MLVKPLSRYISAAIHGVLLRANYRQQRAEHQPRSLAHGLHEASVAPAHAAR